MDKETLKNGYFEDSLSQDQLMEFEQLLKTDSDFASDVDFQKELRLSLKKGERHELKQMFNELNTKEELTETKIFNLRPWLAAASIALILSLSTWMFYFNSSEINQNELYAANFAPYDNVVHPIERGNEIADLKTRLFSAYEAQDYKLWLTLTAQMTAKQKDDYIDFYSGIVYMQLENHEKAIPLLKGYINGDGELNDRATWYLALAHLKLGDISKSKEALEILIEMGSFKKKDAELLLEKIN